MVKKVIFTLFSLSLFAQEILIFENEAFVKEEKTVKNGYIQLPKCTKANSLVFEDKVPSYRFVLAKNLLDLLELFVGKEVEFIKEDKKLKGTLLSTHPIIVQSDRLYFDLKPKDFIFKSFPKGFNLEPQVLVETNKKELEVGYECNNVRWNSIYNLKLDKNLHLQGFIHINTPEEFSNMKLSLVARREKKVGEMPIFKAARATTSIEAVEGNYIYTLPKRYDIKDNLFINYIDEEVPYKKRFIVKWNNLKYAAGEEEKHFLQLITFVAPKPLPKGVARFFKNGVLLSTTRFKPLSQGEKATLEAGEDFDLKVTRKVLKREEDKKRWKSEVLYLFENPKGEKVTLEVIEMIPTTKLKIKGDCEYKKLDASHLLIKTTLKGTSKICHFSFKL